MAPTVTAHDKFVIDVVFDKVRKAVDRDVKNNKGQRPKQPTVVDAPEAFQVVFDVTGYGANDLKITVEGDEFTLDGEAESVVDGKKGAKKSFQKSFGVPPDVKVDETTAQLSADGWLVFTVPRKEGSFVKTTTTTKATKLEVLGKGPFAQDSFFFDMRSMFEKALKETKSKYPETDSIRDEKTLFDTLREKNFADNKQVETSEEDKRNFKAVLDVKGYKQQHINVGYAGETINVEGCEENKKGGKSFRKAYVLNKSYNIKGGTVGYAFDGILGIKIPKSK